MLRVNTGRVPVPREVVWFASGDYDRATYPAAVTYFRQHRLRFPPHYVVSGDAFHTLFLDLSKDVDELAKGVSRTLRYEIRRADRESIHVVNAASDHATISQFCLRHAAFTAAKRLGGPLAAWQLENLKGSWTLYSAFQAERWLVDLLLIHDHQRTRMWALSSSQHQDLRKLVSYASKLTIWRSICDARANRFSIYDFGGIVLDQSDLRYGITKFKESFGGYRVEEHNSLVIPNPIVRVGYWIFSRIHER